MFIPVVQQFKKQLRQLDLWLEAATTYATEKKFEADRFLGFRLAPDQFGFARQIQATCDVAKLATARLTGQDAPKHADDETTIEQLRARIASVLAFLDGIPAAAFDGAGERVISQPRWEGKTMTGADYFIEHAVPNFYFHLNHSYAILRHNGVPVGKRDYLGAMTYQAAKAD